MRCHWSDANSSGLRRYADILRIMRAGILLVAVLASSAPAAAEEIHWAPPTAWETVPLIAAQAMMLALKK